MFMLIRNGMTSMFELEEYYTLDEALKLHALMSMLGSSRKEENDR